MPESLDAVRQKSEFGEREIGSDWIGGTCLMQPSDLSLLCNTWRDLEFRRVGLTWSLVVSKSRIVIASQRPEYLVFDHNP